MDPEDKKEPEVESRGIEFTLQGTLTVDRSNEHVEQSANDAEEPREA